MGADLYDRDREYFLSFLARTNQKERTLEHLDDYLEEYTPQTVGAIRKGRPVRFLDVGAGTGRVTIPFISSLEGSIDCVVQEPSIGMMVNLFLRYLSEGLPYERLTLMHKKEPDYELDKFDFVLASHSFYYIDDWEGTLQAIYDSLVPGGAACVIMSSMAGELHKLRSMFFPKLFGFEPKSAEDLADVLDGIGIPYDAVAIDSKMDLKPEQKDEIKILREDGVWRPSLESLFSFLLRTDYSKIPAEMQEEIKDFVYGKAHRGRYFGLRDLAIWFRKEEAYAERQENLVFGPRRITIADFVNTFGPMLEENFGNDLSFLSHGLKEAYFSILALDCVLSHPLSRISISWEGNSLVTQDDSSRPYPVPGKRIRDFVLIDPKYDIRSIQRTLGFDRDFYILFYDNFNNENQTFLREHIEQEYGFLPDEDKKILSKEEFSRLMFDTFRRFRHNQIFSNRYAGDTIIGLCLDPDCAAIKEPLFVIKP